MKKRHVPEGYKLVFTSKITVKGKAIYARTYGKKCFAILVKE